MPTLQVWLARRWRPIPRGLCFRTAGSGARSWRCWAHCDWWRSQMARRRSQVDLRLVLIIGMKPQPLHDLAAQQHRW